MILEYIQDGVKKVLKTPRKTYYCNVIIKNRKSAIVVVVRKKNVMEKKSIRFRNLGEALLQDKIGLLDYHQKKEKLKKRTKRTFTIKVKKDEGTLVKIQKEFFEQF